MDQKPEKLFDEFPSFVGPAAAAGNVAAEQTQYGVDDFSIYKVGQDKAQPQQPASETKQLEPTRLDFNDPTAFEITSASPSNNYVDLDFNLDQTADKYSATQLPSPIVSETQPKTTTTAAEKDLLLSEEAFAASVKSPLEDTIVESIENEKFEPLYDMSVSSLSFSENNLDSSLAENLDKSAYLLDDPTPITEEGPPPTLMTDSSVFNVNATSQLEIDATTSYLASSDTTDDSNRSSLNNTKIEVHPLSQTTDNTLGSPGAEPFDAKPAIPKMVSLSDLLPASTDAQSSLAVDTDIVPDTDDYEVYGSEPVDDYISQFTSSVPSIPEEESTGELTPSLSTFTAQESSFAPEALVAEQVILGDGSSNDSDSPDLSKEPSKPSPSASPVNGDTISRVEYEDKLPPVHPITEAKTVDVQSGFAQEFTVNSSTLAQQFVEEPALKSESPVGLLESVPATQPAPVVESLFAASEAVSTFAPPPPPAAPAMSTFTLPPSEGSSASSIGGLTSSTLVESNTLPVDSTAQVAASTHWSAAVEEKQGRASSAAADDYEFDAVASAPPVATSTTADSAPVAESTKLPWPPSSPPPASTLACEVPVPQQQKQEEQSEHIEAPPTTTISEPLWSTSNLLSTSASNPTPVAADQVLSALEEEAEEEDEQQQQVENEKTDYESSAPATAEAEEGGNTLRDESVADTAAAASAAVATAATVPKTTTSRQQPVSFASSFTPDTTTAAAASSASTSTTMGRKNQFRRDNSADESEFSGPDQVKEYIEGVLGPCVAELVYWRDPKNTGLVFGAGLVILLSLSIFSVISVVAYTLLFTLLGTLSFRVYKNVLQAVQKTSEGHPFKEYLDIEIAPSQDRIHEIVDSLVGHGTCFAKRMRSVLLVEDIVDSLKYLLIFWALTYIGAWFNGLTLVILAYISAFSLPKVYEQNKAQIDTYLELVNGKIAEISDKVPFLKKVPVEKKDE